MTGSRTLSRGLDYLGDLGAKLRDLQGFRTLAHELIQNADDAKTATSIAFDITQNSLVVDNDGVFSDCRNIEAAECPWKADGIHNHRCDFHRFRKVAAGDKRAEEGTTGAFGIGFIAVYQITDAPELISGGRHWILQEAKPEDERILICDGCRKCVEADLPGTRFILPWAFDQQSILRQALQAEAVSSHAPDRMLNELRQCAPIAMLFLKRLREITVKQAGRIVKAWQRLDEGKSLLLTDGSPENDHVWHIINGQFASVAQRLRQAHPGRIEEKRSFNVTLAIPSTDLRAGLLCACLPTEHDVGLPFHVNADFFPTNDRKRIILEEDYQSEWNCAALRAGAVALSNAIDDMPRLLGGHRFWSFVSVLKQVAEKAEQDQRHSELREFWVQTAPHLRTASVVLTSQGKWVIADNASLLLQREESAAIALLESLGILIVHEDLRPFHTVLRADAGVALLDIETITKALTRSGLTKRTQVNDLPAGLKPVTAREVLWGEIDLLLERQQRTPKTKAEDERRLHDVALAPGQDGALWPCREIYSADADTINLFHSIGLAIPFLDAENGFSRLKHLCPNFDARAAIKFLEGVNTGLIQQLWEKNKLPLPPLFEWFENRRQEILANPELKSRLGTLTLFPGAGKLRILDRLSLPGDFVDPLVLAELVDLEAVGGRREFLRDLGMPELSFTTYATAKLPAVLADQAIPAEKLRVLTILLATHIGELKGNDVAQASLAATKIVECTDGVFRRAVECHFGTESVRVCLGNSAHVAVLPRGHEMRVRDFYAWLGVSDVPRISSIVARVRNFARLPYSRTNTKEIQNIVAYLGKNIEDPGEVPALNPLQLDKWLPARGRSDRWYAADELYAAYQDYLFESQSRFIDLPPNVQGTSRKLFEFLGIGITPTARLVVKHLLYCSVQQIPVNTQVYRFLNDEVQDIALGELTGKKCLWLGDAYYSASEVFWGEHPFGRYRKQLGDELRIYSGLLKQLNVRETPTWEDAVSVLREISTEFGSQNSLLDEEAYAVLMACWRSIGEALDSGAVPIEAISDLRSVKCVPGPNHVLNPPEWMFFENRVGLAAKFGKFLANNVIARPLGTGRALDEAGVRGLGTAVQLDLLESVDPVDDPIMSERLSTRRNEMGRVLESARSSCDTAAVLKRLENIRCQETASIKIRYRLEIFNHQLQSDEEQVPALYLPEQTTLLYTPRNNDVPWAAISRELATALFPEEDPGRFAAGLKEVLAADSVEEAAATLDELGFAKLDTSVAGPTTLGEPVDTLGTETVDEGHVPPAEPQGEPGDGSEELTPEEAIKRLLGGDASPPTPPVVPAGAEPIGTSNGKAAGTSRKKGRPVLRSYVPAPGNADSESKTDTNSAEKGRSPVDEAGIRRVMDFETAAGRTPKEMPHTNEGYDIESCGRTGEVIRYIEVKSLSGRWRDSFAVLSRPQFKMEWDDHKDLFWLYVVEQPESDEFQIHRIPNPALKANHFMFDDGWRSLAEAEEEKEE